MVSNIVIKAIDPICNSHEVEELHITQIIPVLDYYQQYGLIKLATGTISPPLH